MENKPISIDDNLQKKIKKLAAELDTTQSDIVARAITEFESRLGNYTEGHNQIAWNIIKSAISGKPKFAWRKKTRERLTQPGIDIGELEIRSWSE